jgi:hypothetical protein
MKIIEGGGGGGAGPQTPKPQSPIFDKILCLILSINSKFY